MDCFEWIYALLITNKSLLWGQRTNGVVGYGVVMKRVDALGRENHPDVSLDDYHSSTCLSCVKHVEAMHFTISLPWFTCVRLEQRPSGAEPLGSRDWTQGSPSLSHRPWALSRASQTSHGRDSGTDLKVRKRNHSRGPTCLRSFIARCILRRVLFTLLRTPNISTDPPRTAHDGTRREEQVLGHPADLQ